MSTVAKKWANPREGRRSDGGCPLSLCLSDLAVKIAGHVHPPRTSASTPSRAASHPLSKVLPTARAARLVSAGFRFCAAQARVLVAAIRGDAPMSPPRMAVPGDHRSPAGPGRSSSVIGPVPPWSAHTRLGDVGVQRRAVVNALWLPSSGIAGLRRAGSSQVRGCTSSWAPARAGPGKRGDVVGVCAGVDDRGSRRRRW